MSKTINRLLYGKCRNHLQYGRIWRKIIYYRKNERLFFRMSKEKNGAGIAVKVHRGPTALKNTFGVLWMATSFFAVELFLRFFAGANGLGGLWMSLCWAVVFTALLLIFPRILCRILYGLAYFAAAAFAVGQAGTHKILGHMIWLSDVVHLSEGADYGGTITGGLDVTFWLLCALLIAAGVIGIIAAPKFKRSRWRWIICLLIAALGMTAKHYVLQDVLYYDKDDAKMVQYVTKFVPTKYNAGIYDTLYEPEPVFKICGYYQLLEQDVIRHHIKPLLPSYRAGLEAKKAAADEFYAERTEHSDNEMTGIFEGKNVIMVLMETMDDFLVSEEDTPTMCRMMREGINFTNFYTPIYSSIHTFNTEYCVNAGHFLPTSGKTVLYYSGNDFSQTLPSRLASLGYSAQAFHYNTSTFYNRGVMLPAIGFDAYNSYVELTGTDVNDTSMFDECFLFKNAYLREKFFPDTPFYNYVITRNAHTPFAYDDALSEWSLAKHPEYRGKYGREDLDVICCKVRLIDDLFAELIGQLEQTGHLDDTVIVAFGDHYAYPMNDQQLVFERSGVDNAYLAMKTPCFIWAKGMEPVEVSKTLNTADLVPTLVNLLGLDFEAYDYLGRDAFDPDYEGFVVFGDGAWLYKDVLFSGGTVTEELTEGAAAAVDIDKMQDFVTRYLKVNDAMLETDYYKK